MFITVKPMNFSIHEIWECHDCWFGENSISEDVAGAVIEELTEALKKLPYELKFDEGDELFVLNSDTGDTYWSKDEAPEDLKKLLDELDKKTVEVELPIFQ